MCLPAESAPLRTGQTQQAAAADTPYPVFDTIGHPSSSACFATKYKAAGCVLPSSTLYCQLALALGVNGNPLIANELLVMLLLQLK